MKINAEDLIANGNITTEFEINLPKIKAEDQSELHFLLKKVSNIVIKNITALEEKKKDCNACPLQPICKILKKENCNDKAESRN